MLTLLLSALPLFSLAQAFANQTIFTDGVVNLHWMEEDVWSPVTIGLSIEEPLTDSLFRRSLLPIRPRTALSRDIPGSTISVTLPIDSKSRRVVLPHDLSLLNVTRDTSSPEMNLVKRVKHPYRPGRRHKHKKHIRHRHKKPSHRIRKPASSRVVKVGKQVKKKSVDVQQTMTSTITWYTGHDLLYPSCVTSSKWNPTDKSLVAAVTLKWDGAPACGSFVRLRAAGASSEKAVIVRVMDTCAGCKPQSNHFDLTRTGFKLLYDLDIGIVTTIQAQVLSGPPFKEWTPAMTALYGPQTL